MTGLEPALRHAAVEERLVPALAAYGRLVLETNRQFNLTGAKEPEEMLDQLLDSLTVVPYVGDPYVDVGSGAGLPALPAMLATGVAGTLIEANLKKGRFLTTATQQLGLRAAVITERAEVAGQRESLREQFASGTARAVATAPAAAELLLPLIALGGMAILQQGRLDAAERRALEDAALMLGGRIEEERAVAGDRRLILIRKERSTPSRFPRRTGVPQKRPLCST